MNGHGNSHYAGGIHAVRALLERTPEDVLELHVQRDRHDKRVIPILNRAEKRGIPIFQQDREALDRLRPGLRHQGVVAKTIQVPAKSEADLETLVEAAREPVLLLVLDGVQDPHNLGACLRSADAAGALAVIAPKDKACGLTPVVRKVASGGAETVPFIPVTNLAQALQRLRRAGVWIIGTVGESGESLFRTKLIGPVALVMGAEGKGLRRLTREHCDELIHIPMAGGVESLNVSVAAGVCLFEARRQRCGQGSKDKGGEV